jgi:hypothetical protein
MQASSTQSPIVWKIGRRQNSLAQLRQNFDLGVKRRVFAAEPLELFFARGECVLEVAYPPLLKAGQHPQGRVGQGLS